MARADFNFTSDDIRITEPENYNFNFGDAVFSILAGQSKYFISIWADPDANVETARMYVGSAGPGAAFSVVDLADESLVDSYLIDKEGEYDEFLDREDIVDINVSTTGV